MNCKSLEFLYLNDIDFYSIDPATIQMIKVKVFVIASDTDKSEEEMVKLTVMCPNAEIVVCKVENLRQIRDVIKSRRKRKGFSIDTQKYIRMRE